MLRCSTMPRPASAARGACSSTWARRPRRWPPTAPLQRRPRPPARACWCRSAATSPPAGPHPAGGWPIHVTDDHRDGADAPGQTVADRARAAWRPPASSARWWSLRDGPMHHILDPRDGLPVRSGVAHRERRRGDLRGGQHRLHRGDRARRRRAGWLASTGPAGTAWSTLDGTARSSAAGRGDRGTERYWYLTRASGTVALILLTLSVVDRHRGVRPGASPALAAVRDRRHPPHRLAAGASRSWSSTSPPPCWTASRRSRCVDAVIPFAGSYRPLWLGLGAVAFDLLLAVVDHQPGARPDRSPNLAGGALAGVSRVAGSAACTGWAPAATCAWAGCSPSTCCVPQSC